MTRQIPSETASFGRSNIMTDGPFAEWKIPLPYYSQWRDIARAEWRPRACGIAALAMVLELGSSAKAPRDLDRMIDRARSLGAHDPSIGWIHAGLIALAREDGALLASRVYRAKEDPVLEAKHAQSGIAEIREELANGRPVIASVRRGFREDGTPHMVVLSGAGEGPDGPYFLIHDPDDHEEEGAGYRRVSSENFEKNWRKLAIFWGSPAADGSWSNSQKNPLK